MALTFWNSKPCIFFGGGGGGGGWGGGLRKDMKAFDFLPTPPVSAG